MIVSGPPSDPEFNVNTESEVLLHRKVEVYCYEETITEVEERQGDKVRKAEKCNYTSKWVEES